jgi:hypothetical protein
MIDAVGECGLVFGAIDRGVGGRVDDEVRTRVVQRARERNRVGEIRRHARRSVLERPFACRCGQFAEWRERTQQLEADLAVRAVQVDLHAPSPLIMAGAADAALLLPGVDAQIIAPSAAPTGSTRDTGPVTGMSAIARAARRRGMGR